jgi:prevent-host-death family protein
MGRVVNIHAAKTHFSKLVDEVEAGGEVIIARAGKPVLKLVRLEPELDVPRQLGFAKGLLDIPDWAAFEASDAEIAETFNRTKFDYLDGE